MLTMRDLIVQAFSVIWMTNVTCYIISRILLGSPLLRALGWATAVVMTAAGIGMLVTL
jgi:hypothetical protein